MHKLYTSKLRGRAIRAMEVLFLLLIVSHGALAQNRTITGTVIGEDDGFPVPGATVVVEGTTRGTITNMEGEFTMEVTEGDEVISISFVGYKTQNVRIGNQSTITVRLPLDVTALEEVVVLGYGSQKKKVVTAATAKVSGEDLEKRLSTNAFQAMQGQAAGVSIRSNSGQPGDGFKVNIRGLGTIGNADPLYIVDGVQTGDIKYLNNADIESIDVLKDAASAAIYGSRAANGVVLITTKQGRPGQVQITFDSYYGLQNRPTDPGMLNAHEYAQIRNEQHLNSGGSVSSLPFDINNLPSYTEDGPADTDWMDEMFVKNAVTQNYSVGISGGSEQTTYSLGFSYTGQEGIVGGKENSDYDRYNARINTENKLYGGKLKVGENLTYTYIRKNGVKVSNQYSNTLRGAFNTSPLLPLYNDYGEFFNAADTITDQFGKTYWNPTESSPYASMVLTNQNETNEQKLLGNVYAELELMPNLRVRTSLALDHYSDEYRELTPAYELSDYAVEARSKVTQKMSRNRTLQLDNYATYNVSMGRHFVELMGGMSVRDYKRTWLEAGNADLIFDDFKRAWIVNTTNEEGNLKTVKGAPIGDGTEGHEDENGQDRLLSYFSRLQYNYDEKYLFNATFRADGSSKFAKGHQWGFFPAVSGGWVISEEGFMQGVPFIDFAKVRASWGQNGNQNIPSFQFLAPIKFTQATYAFGDEENQNTPGAYQNRLADENVKWETSEQIDIGADFRLFANRVKMSVDWYKKSTIDWLIKPPAFATAGADPAVTNGGRVENTGVEMELAYDSQIGDLSYVISVNGAYNKNRVREIPNEEQRILKGQYQLFDNSPHFYMAEPGHPIGYFWGFETDGLFQNNTEVAAHTNSEGKLIQSNAKPGDVRFVDRNDDGVLDNLDKVEIGNPNPLFNFGFNISANYKAFDFSIMSYGVAGNDIVQSYRNHSGQNANYTKAVLDRWTGEGTSSDVPRVTNNNVNYARFSDLFIQDGSFLRIGNITLGYDLASVLNVSKVAELRVYFAVNNLYTFTKYTGMDPDVGFGFDNDIQDRFSSGIDVGFYPNPRTTLIGLSAKF